MNSDGVSVTIRRLDLVRVSGRSEAVEIFAPADDPQVAVAVAIDGVSLVTNYRASFSNTIRQNGIDGLIKTLAAQSARGGAKPAPRPGS